MNLFTAAADAAAGCHGDAVVMAAVQCAVCCCWAVDKIPTGRDTARHNYNDTNS